MQLKINHLVIILISCLFSVAILTCCSSNRSDTSPALEIVSVSEHIDDAITVVRIKTENRLSNPVEKVFFLLTVFDHADREIANSLTNSIDITGPWIGNVANKKDAISYQGQQGFKGQAVLVYSIGSKSMAQCEFHMTKDFVTRYGKPEKYAIEIKDFKTGQTIASKK